MYILGIDIGTSACKAAAFSYSGEERASFSESYKVYYPQRGYAEQNPLEWYDAVCASVKKIVKAVGSENISAACIDGQGWSCIPLDKNGDVLYNTPIWFDVRSTKECEFLINKIGGDEIFNLCKNPVKPSYTTPKVLWFKKNGIYNKTHMFLQSNSYIAYRFTGEFTGDKSNGYAHFFYDMESSCYNEKMAEKMEIDLSKFPKLYNCHEIIGGITKKAALETGLKENTPVAAGGLDAACGTLGAGVYKTGQTQEQGGQAGGMSIALGAALSHKQLILSNHVVNGTWLLQGGTVGGGGALKWFSENFGAAFSGENIFKAIDEAANTIEKGSEGLIFLPYMNGERSPLWNENAKGVFYGLDYSKTKNHMARALLEGIAFSLLHNIDTAKSAGAFIKEMNATGGAAKSSVWTQIKADVTGIPINVMQNDNQTALGAAILAGVGTGVYKNFDDAVQKTVRQGKKYVPCEHEKYEKFYKEYLNLSNLLNGGK